MSERPPLKLLCLHGYHQSAASYRVKVGGIRKKIKKRCEYIWFDAPHPVPDSEDFGWWFSSDETYDALVYNDFDKGLDESIEFVAKVFKEQGPFDGLLAFSQGACLAAILCCLKEKGDERFQGFNFAIIGAGYKSRQSQHQKYYEDVIVTLPTVHTIGEKDGVIPPEMSEDLLSLFDPANTKIARHDKGHLIPAAAEAKTTIIDFLDKMRDARF